MRQLLVLAVAFALIACKQAVKVQVMKKGAALARCPSTIMRHSRPSIKLPLVQSSRLRHATVAG